MWSLVSGAHPKRSDHIIYDSVDSMGNYSSSEDEDTTYVNLRKKETIPKYK